MSDNDKATGSKINLNSELSKRALALIRNADFAHPGEYEAIDLVMSHFTRDPSRAILDLGCGLGGTADYIQRQGWGIVSGVDIDPSSIETARQKYPDNQFICCAAEELSKFTAQRYDIIYLLSVFHALNNQADALREMRKVVAPTGTLCIFDYTAKPGDPKAIAYAERPRLTSWKGINLETIEVQLHDAGWKITEQQDLTARFEGWYCDLVAKINGKREPTVALCGPNWYDNALATYSHLLDVIQSRSIGGVLIYAKPF